jgi:hypothetical protein
VAVCGDELGVACLRVEQPQEPPPGLFIKILMLANASSEIIMDSFAEVI